MRTSAPLAVPILAALIPVAAASPTAAQAQEAAAIGPLGVRCHALRVDPDDPDSIVAALESGTTGSPHTIGVMRSQDSGATWVQANTVAPNAPSLGVAGGGTSTDRVVAIVGTGVYVSENDGRTFSLVHDFGETLTLLAVHPTEDVWLVGSPLRLWRSDDLGATFDEVFSTTWSNSLQPEATFAPSDPDRAYVLTYEQLYRSDDAGATWEPGKGDVGSHNELAVHPSDADRVYVGNLGRVWISSDAGDTYTPVVPPLFGFVHELAFEPGVAPRLWVGLGSEIFAYDEPGWTSMSDGLEIASYPIAYDLVFAGGDAWLGSTSGIWRSTSASSPWERVGVARELLHASAVPEPGARVTGGRNFFVSEGLGTQEELFVPDPELMSVATLAVDPKDPTRWLAGMHYIAGSEDVPLLDVSGSGSSYVHVGACGPCGTFRDVKFDPFDLDHVLVTVAYPTTFVVATYDDGSTWDRQYGLSESGTVALAFDPSQAGRVLALALEGQLMESVDGGVSWTTIETPPAPTTPAELEFDPHVAGRVFRASVVQGWERSDDGGATWTPLGLPAHEWSRMEFHPTQPGLVWLPDDAGGLWLSGDGGATAVQVFATPGGSPVSDLALDALDGSLLVATLGESAFVLPEHAPYVQLGGGTPGGSGVVPGHLAEGGLPAVGNAGWGLVVEEAAAGAVAALFVGTSEVALPLLGGTFLPGPPYPVLAAGVTDGAGGASFPLPLPANPSLAGLTLTSQVAVDDAGATGGFALSSGLRATLL